MGNDTPHRKPKERAMTNNQTQQKVNINPYIAMLHGNDSSQNQLSPAEKNKLKKMYMKMYFSLALTLWANGKTLGTAWQTALTQMESFIKSKGGANNPAIAYLQQVHAAHRTKWSRVIMTSKNRDMKLPKNPELIKKIREFAAKNMRDGIGQMNQIIKSHQPKEQEKQQINTPQQVFSDAQMLMIMRMRQMGRGENSIAA